MTPAFDRAAHWQRLRQTDVFDLLVIGGGATGLGVALDAAARGFAVAVVEAEDFAKGTSSRATKLVHGGVRYLAQGQLALVREALHERRTLLDNAPHLARPLAFVVPAYGFIESAMHRVGLEAYDLMAGKSSLGRTQFLNTRATLDALPGVRQRGLAGGVRYWDGQFDDARLAVALARTAAARGAVVVNHTRATLLLRDGQRVAGATVRDEESGELHHVRARCVVNATGVWVDRILALDTDPQRVHTAEHRSIVKPSQGVHLVVDREFMRGESALLVPKTADGRVLFAVPWLGKLILGTTDAPRPDMPTEPEPMDNEVAFILAEAERYLERAPRRRDVRSAWAGLRPLVAPNAAGGAKTKAISREHTVLVAPSGLVTVTGGKWTTYRAMAEDVLERCMEDGLLPRRAAGVTNTLRLAGAMSADAPADRASMSAPPGAHLYGDEAALLASLPGADRWLWREGEGGLSEAMLRFAARFEMARTVEDALARRSRLLFLDARAAHDVADTAAAILRDELGLGDVALGTQAFKALALRYAHVSSS